MIGFHAGSEKKHITGCKKEYLNVTANDRTYLGIF